MNKCLHLFKRILIANIFLLLALQGIAQITVTHPNSGYVNTEAVVEWRISGGTVSSDINKFKLFKNGGDIGNSGITLIEVIEDKDYLIQVDLSSVSGPVNNNDEFSIKYNGSINSIKNYVFDDENPSLTSFTLSSSSQSGQDLDDGITKYENVSFDIVAEVGVNYVIEDGNSNLVASGVSTGSNTIVSSLTGGSYNLLIVLTDLAGNTLTDNFSLEIDKTPPSPTPNVPSIEAADNSGGISPIYTNVNTPRFNVDNLDLTAGNILKIESDLDGVIGTTSLSTNDPEQVLTTITTEGEHKITAIVEDLAGNRVTSAILTFNYDNTPPVAAVLSLQESSNTGRDNTDIYTTEDEPIFDITNIEIGVKLELLKEAGVNPPTAVDQAVSNTTQDNITLTSNTLTDDDIYYYQVKLTDKAGNTKTENLSNVIQLDFNATTTLSSTVSSVEIDNNPTSLTDNYSPNSDVDLKFNGLSPTSPYDELVILDQSMVEVDRIIIDETEELVSLTDLSDGDYTINYLIEDVYGNKNATSSYSFKVDTQVPVISNIQFVSDFIGNNKLLTNGYNTYSLSFDLNENLFEDPSVKVEDSPISITSAGNTYSSSASLTIDVFQEVPIEITVKDLAGNITTIKSPNDINSLFIFPTIQNQIKTDDQTVYCGSNSSIFIETDGTISGGDDTYSYEWQLNDVSLGVINEDLTYNETLPNGSNEFKRIVTSYGEQVESNTITIEVNSDYTNVINAPTQTVYFDQISINDIAFSTSPATGGDNTYSYVWEFFNGSNWEVKDATETYTHDEAISVSGEYKFRREVSTVGGDCNTYSNEVTITLYPQIGNVILSGTDQKCINNTTFEITSTALSGGDDNFTIEWFREKNDEGFIEMTNKTNPTYIETENLTSGSYKYKRVVESAGSASISSNVYTVEVVNEVAGNDLNIDSNNEFYGTINIGEIQISGDVLSGGGEGYTYIWETLVGVNWVVTSVTTEDYSNTSAINDAGTYRFRRTVSSNSCNDDVSAEVNITLYEEITNNTISAISGGMLCKGEDLFILGSTPVGGKGDYTYSWHRKLSSQSDVDYVNLSVSEPFYVSENITNEGDFVYKRVVSSGATSHEITVAINVESEPNIELTPSDGSNYSNSTATGITLDIDQPNNFYCTGTGVVSNGDGAANNKFYPNLAGIGTHQIEYHVSVGNCEYTYTGSIVVYDGQKPFINVNENYCGDSNPFTITYDEADKANDDLNEPNAFRDTYRFIQFEILDASNNLIIEYTGETSFIFDPQVIIRGNGVLSENITLRAKYLKEIINQPLPNPPLVIFDYLQQEVQITYTPEEPEVLDSNPTYCNDLDGLSSLRVTNNVGDVKWYDDEYKEIHTGREYMPNIQPNDIISDQDNDFVYYVSQTVNNCESSLKPINIKVYKETIAPTFSESIITICEGESVPELAVESGDNVIWYDKDNNEVSISETYIPSISTTNFGVNEAFRKFKFKATLTENNCESDKEKVEIIILKNPGIPEKIGGDIEYCSGDTNLQPLKVKAAAGLNYYEWYTDEDLLEKLSETSEELTISSIPSTTDNDIIVSYWVVEVNPNDCKSEPLKIDYTVHPLPVAPSLESDIYELNVCAGNAPLLMKTINVEGSVFWFDKKPEDFGYNQGNRYEGVNYQPNYNTNVDTDATLEYYVAEMSLNNCFGPSRKVTVNIIALPDVPLLLTGVDELIICSEENFPIIEVSGINVKWYSDSGHNDLLYSGNTYDPNTNYYVENDSVVKYYVTSSTSEGCESEGAEIRVNINALPDIPTTPVNGDVNEYCSGDTNPKYLRTEIAKGANYFEWYTDEDLLEKLSETSEELTISSIPSTTDNDVIVSHWVVEVNPNGCKSEPLKIDYTVHPLPIAPSLEADIYELNVCAGGTPLLMKTINVEGSVFWFDKKPEDFGYNQGNRYEGVNYQPNYDTNVDNDVVLEYYVSEKNLNNCFGPSRKVTVNIIALPAAPILQTETNDLIVCSEENFPIVEVSGLNVKWYSDSGHNDLLYNGNTYDPNINYYVESDSIVKYYVTSSTEEGCESENSEVIIDINALPAIPSIPLNADINEYCSGDVSQKYLTVEEANGANYFEWFTDENLLEKLSETSEELTIASIPSTTDNDVIVSHWVVEVNPNGCKSEPLKIDYTVHPLPIPPSLEADIYELNVCAGGTPLLMKTINVVGSVFWFDEKPEDFGYNQANRYEGVNYQPNYDTNVDNDVVLEYYVSEKNLNNCFGPSRKVTVNIIALPDAPILQTETNDLIVCSDDNLPIIEVFGLNVKWYSDSEHNDLLFSGSSYDPNTSYYVENDSIIKYYATSSTTEGCESENTEITVNLKALPSAPNAPFIRTYCEEDEIDEIVVSGELNATFIWYDSEDLDTQIGDSDTFDPDIIAPGFNEIDSLHYWVTQTSEEGCTSLPQRISVPVYPKPAQPQLVQTEFEYCNRETILPINAIGVGVEWFTDQSLTNSFSVGNTLNPSQINTANGDSVQYYYVIQKNDNDCISEYVEVKITVYEETIAPEITQTSFEYCSNEVLQPITVSNGVNIRWYSDINLTNQVASGNSFLPTDSTNVDNDTFIDYFYTETINGCESIPVSINIIINKTPSEPVSNNGVDLNYCSGDIIQTLIILSQSENLKWYSDENLTNLVWEGNNFTPTVETDVTTESTHEYYVTSTHNSCESEATNISITMHPLPVIEIYGITEDRVYCKSDENPIVLSNTPSGNLSSPSGAIISGDNEVLLETSSIGDHILKYTYTNENGCVDSVLTNFTIVDVPIVHFTQSIECNSKQVTFYDSTVISDGDLFTEISEWKYDFGEGEGSVVLSSQEEAQAYTHTFNSRGFKNVTLTIFTNQTCNEISIEKTIFINTPPSANFNWSVSELGQEMLFESILENVEGDPIINHYWDFGDQTYSGISNPSKMYNDVGVYTVRYIIQTAMGCESIIEKDVFVIPHPIVTSSIPYFENFDITNGGWQPTGKDNVSWERGMPITTKFNSTNNAWVTNLDSTYYESEESYLNLPSFDISDLNKPMLAFDMKLDIENGIDGVILQYSTDFGDTWNLLGDINDPINWYNSQSILSDPGDQIFKNNTSSMGWTGDNEGLGVPTSEYISVRHHLDNFLFEEHLRLRFAFKSNSAQEYEGVVVDNFFIGNREKVVLIESMTNAGQEASNRAMASLSDTLETMSTDVLAINYHIQLEGFRDDINIDNPEPSSGRKFYYGITNAPRSIVDGNTFQGHTDDFIQSFQNYIYARTLLDPEFDINVNLENTAETGQIEVSLTSHGEFDADSSEIVVHAVTIEKEIFGVEVTDDINSHFHVMKSMSPAPGAEGTSFFGRSWGVNSTETIFIDWANPSVYTTDNVELIVFVQDNVSKEIFQAISIPLNESMLKTDVISSIEQEVNVWNIFPNPATDQVTITTNQFIKKGSWEISNINGKSVLTGDFTGNNYSIEINNLPSGVYLIRNTSDGEYFDKVIRFVVTK